MPPKYEYRRRLPHLQKEDRPVFITFTTDHRWRLPPLARGEVMECCLKQNGVKFELHTVVVMPDHAHLLLTSLPKRDGWPYSLPEIMHTIKGASARKINLLLGRTGRAWQEEFFDHVLRSNESLAEKVDYICQNPVRAGLMERESDYLWLWRGKLPLL
jgi:putative transposase